MKRLTKLSCAAAMLLISACDQANESGADNMTTADGAEAVELESAVDGVGDAADEANLVSLPEPAATVSSAAAAPLTEATALAQRIERGSGIERISYDGGWAWRENGDIVRTASLDGQRVSYFRPGESTPFLVQRGTEAFAYSDGQVARGFDGSGELVQIDQQHREEGEQLVRKSTEERQQALRVAAEQPERVQATRTSTSDSRQSRNEAPETTSQERPQSQARVQPETGATRTTRDSTPEATSRTGPTAAPRTERTTSSQGPANR